MTLKDLKKLQGLTNADIGIALGVSASVAGMILQGRHISVMHDGDIEKLADVLGITFERCWLALVESINTFMGTPGAIHQRADEVRQEAQTWLAERMPDVDIPIDEPRALAMIDSVLVVSEDRRIAMNANNMLNENMMLVLPEDKRELCHIGECLKPARVMIYHEKLGWFGVCPSCIADMARYDKDAKKEWEKP